MWGFVAFFCLIHISSSRFLAQRTLPCQVNSSENSVTFNCSGRKFTSVPNGIYSNTTNLDLSNNYIQNISSQPLSHLNNLTFLNLKGNKRLQVTNGAFLTLSVLEVLILDGSHISKVPEELPSGLQKLSLNSNRIQSIGQKDFQTIPHIKVIRLNNNCYTESKCSSSLSIHEKTFCNLAHLRNLSLNQNNLTCIPTNLPTSLVELNLNLNAIQHIGNYDLKNLTRLKVLDLSGNCPKCSNAPFPCRPCQTKSGSMEIDTFAFKDLSSLEELHLSGNSLKKIQVEWFQNITQLKVLYLSFNFLANDIATGEFLPFLPLAEILDLSFNNDKESHSSHIKLSANFTCLRSLRTLHMESYIFQDLIEKDLRPLYGLRNLSVLNLGTNFLEYANLSLFAKFSNLSVIYLSENKLAFSSLRDSSLQMGCAVQKQVQSADRRRGLIIHKDSNYRLYPPSLKRECLHFGPVLDLSKNNLFYLNPNFFHNMEKIRCLNLSSNSIGVPLNGTEFTDIPNLKYLDLSYNKVYLSSDYAFSELENLEVLDLSHNNHYFLVTGVQHNLAFLNHLNFLQVLNLSWNEISVLTYTEIQSKSLKNLVFQGNRLDVMWKSDHSYYRLFTSLANLTYLDISYNMLKEIPTKVYENFPKTLKSLNLCKNKLQLFQWEKMLTQLEELDLSNNFLDVVPKNIHKVQGKLKALDLSYNRISQLADGFLRGANSLMTLDLSHNKLNIINHSTFMSGPENNLRTLGLEGNPFHCTCDILDFLLWIDANDVDIPNLAARVTCDMPPERRYKGVISFDIGECVNDDNAQRYFFICFSFILSGVISALTLHLLYWDVAYLCYYLKAKVKGYYHMKESVFDAFITYDTKDPLVSDWVVNHLRVQLEENSQEGLPICLEERDWIPGAPLIDNLSQSIRQSRKTVFVLTEAYVCSGTFKMAIYLAHQRLLDHGEDVMVLLLLEPVLRHSQFLRLRRRLCGGSVLDWPRNPSAEPWFFQTLRNVIRTDNQAMYSKLSSNYFTTV